jgi:hypothetical protein
MPGLVGIVTEDGVNEQLVDRMTNSIKHEEFHQVDKYINPYFGVARVQKKEGINLILKTILNFVYILLKNMAQISLKI